MTSTQALNLLNSSPFSEPIGDVYETAWRIIWEDSLYTVTYETDDTFTIEECNERELMWFDVSPDVINTMIG